MGMKSGPKLVVDYNVTYQLVCMDDFWHAGTQELKDELFADAKDGVQKAQAAAAGQSCTGCTTLKAAITPLHNKLWTWIAKAVEVGVSVDWLVDFITSKRGYRPSPIEVYYRCSTGFQRTLVL
jgi:hypothetical protein